MFFCLAVLYAQVNKLELLGGNHGRGLTLINHGRKIVELMILGEVHALFTFQPTQDASVAAVIRLLVLLRSDSIATRAALAALAAVHAAAIAQQAAPIVWLLFLGAGEECARLIKRS